MQLVREGRKQARSIVIDLHRTEMSDEEALKQVDKAMGRYSDVESVLFITHEREFIERRRDG